MTATLTRHATAQAEAKGFDMAAVMAAVESPQITYPSGNHPGQERRIRGGLCVVYDPAREVVVTVYAHRVHTPIRPDQAVPVQRRRPRR